MTFFGNNARSGPWWDPMRTFYGTQSMSIVISTQNGYGDVFNIFANVHDHDEDKTVNKFHVLLCTSFEY